MMRMILLIAIAGLLAGCKEDDPAALPPRPVVSEIVRTNQIEARDLTGTVAARVETDLGFQATGRIISRPVSIGDVVARGSVLAELDPDDLESARQAAAAGLSAAKVRLETARRASERTRALVARGVATVAQQESADSALSSAKAELERATAVLTKAEDALGFAVLRAPLDGVITDVLADAGAVVSAGQPVVRLAGTRDREAVVDLPESAVEALGDDAVFEVGLRGFRDIRTTARVTEIEPVADSATRTRQVHLELKEPPASMRLGVLVHVHLIGGGGALIAVPESAILSENGASYVWRVKRPEDRVERIAAEVSPLGDGRVRVHSGVDVGDEIVTRGVHSLEAGQRVGPRVQ
ncbi:MAG: HlyD family secretion protein [Confluentimicrobium sp.]|uniref:RND family efflux transporter MFP subunit n=1 Tax=Actibacterium naphthalenivorans TaxID=1614693 RepID=A0A840CEP7_9RHOB|nr:MULTISPECIES: efflux RND transporter periplasmic adaptor subunit [Actibacterium]ALG90118.1 hypothetical protein TQ29_07870 [Actibacterium sp. EMB200-NS6]MBB4021988.1 RND family efflux transporter MFP subunit [Actibacterium naphthalenivorans]MBC57860.1 HlyD family secretion protein [Actibacterium sp.]|tara:strand:+ start:1444 stop:2502 length:1059 start_codon:yes stop_codon:yes gene_type:complete